MSATSIAADGSTMLMMVPPENFWPALPDARGGRFARGVKAYAEP
jgi:hypothetical protein